MMPTDQPAVPLPQPPATPPPMAGCRLLGAERAPGAPSPALKPAAWFHPQPRPASAGARFCRAGFPARPPSPEPGKQRRLPPRRADRASPVRGSSAKAPRLRRRSPRAAEDLAPQQAGMNRGCSHEGLRHPVLNHRLLISHVKSLISSASPGGGSESLAG